MALDLAADDAPRRWFGFSPAVVVAAAGVLAVGGGAVATASGTPSYAEVVQEVCAESGAAMEADAEALNAGRVERGGLAESNIFSDIARNTGRRLTALRLLEPDATSEPTHQRLIAAEEHVMQLTVAGRDALAREGLASVTPNFRAAMQAMADADAVYVELGVPKGCAD